MFIKKSGPNRSNQKRSKKSYARKAKNLNYIKNCECFVYHLYACCDHCTNFVVSVNLSFDPKITLIILSFLEETSTIKTKQPNAPSVYPVLPPKTFGTSPRRRFVV